MIVSVHIPRTAGSSFRAYLRQHPSIHVVEDYGNPIFVPSLVRNSVATVAGWKQRWKKVDPDTDIIHGHFLPTTYRHLRAVNDTKFITWFREPADRIRSQYDYCFQSDKSIDKSPFQNRVFRENWTFSDFYSHANAQNIYSKFLWHFSIEYFDFIGIVEHYKEDFRYFCHTYFQDDEPKEIFGNRTLSSFASDADKVRIRELNEADYALYEIALKKREQRMQQAAKHS